MPVPAFRKTPRHAAARFLPDRVCGFFVELQVALYRPSFIEIGTKGRIRLGILVKPMHHNVVMLAWQTELERALRRAGLQQFPLIQTISCIDYSLLAFPRFQDFKQDLGVRLVAVFRSCLTRLPGPVSQRVAPVRTGAALRTRPGKARRRASLPAIIRYSTMADMPVLHLLDPLAQYRENGAQLVP